MLDKIPRVLTNEEFADMMQEFDSAGQWMVERLALKRATASDISPKHASTDSSLSAASDRKAIDDNQS